MQVSGQMEVVKTMMDAETPARKLSYMIQGIIWTILFATMGGIYLSYMVNANKWNDTFDVDHCEDSAEAAQFIAQIKALGGDLSCKDLDDRVYDLMFWAGPFDISAQEQADYMSDLKDWDVDKIALGSRFSVVYAFCGITFIMIATANLCISIGAYNLQARMLGGCCGCCFGCINFAALITTAVFRFNTMGSLAALSETPTKYTENGNMIVASDDTTYMTDASTILALWIVQMLACVCSCCVSMFLNKPPSQEEIARAMQSQGIDDMTHH